MVVEEVSLKAYRSYESGSGSKVDVMLWKVEVGSDGADLCSGSDFGFCY